MTEFSNSTPRQSATSLRPIRLRAALYRGRALPARAPDRAPLNRHSVFDWPELLESWLSHTKQGTSQFLIDNFQHVSSLVAGARSSTSFASFASATSRISNRPSPRLEMPVSHRKQTIGLISNRPKFAVCNFCYSVCHASLPPCLFASSPSLIANDMHSRAESNPCKQTTYNFLIANENQLSMLPESLIRSPKVGQFAASRLKVKLTQTGRRNRLQASWSPACARRRAFITSLEES